MSDVPGAVKKGLQDLKDEITCPVCQEFFQDPKILPCFHYYCKRCVLQLAAREQPFPCPECRGDTLLPPTGADGFPTAFFVNRMKSLHDGMEKVQGATSSGDLICEQCRSDKAVAFCRHCAQYICDHCRESHRRMKMLSGHTVVSIEELRRNAEENLPIVQPEPMRCKEHQEQLKIYCFTCNQLICRDCTILDHKDHHFQFVSKCAPQIKQALQEKLGPLQSTQAHIQDARKQLEQSGNEITAQGTHLEKVINGSFDEMIEVLERRRRELLTTVRGRVKEKLSSLSSQEKGLEVCTAQIQSLVDFVGQNIGNASDEEIVSIHKQLQCKIEEEMKSCNSLDLTPAASANIGVDISCAAEIAELCQKKTSVITLPDPSKCRAEGPGMEGAVTNTPTQLVVRTVYSNGQPCREKQSIRAELKSMVDGSIVVAEVTEKEKGSYLVSYCPKVRGRHKLNLLVNQQPIAGSPFNVFVEHPPTQLGEPVHIIKGVKVPYTIALNKSGHLLVTQPGKGVVAALSKDGRVVPGGKDGLGQPRGIAIDEDGSLLAASRASEQLMKFNKDWTLAKAVGQKGDQPGQFNGIGRVKISPTTHKYYVCDRKNHRIQVFDQDLKHVSSFGRHGVELGEMNHPCDVAFDDAGHVYVVDSGNHRVQKFSPRGEPLMTFRSRAAATGKVAYPIGIHISRQLVYVTDWTPSVSVFTTNGEFVASFGSKEELDAPCGITADEDGFLYVCDWKKKHIVVY